MLDIARAGADVVALERLDKSLERQPVAPQASSGRAARDTASHSRRSHRRRRRPSTPLSCGRMIQSCTVRRYAARSSVGRQPLAFRRQIGAVRLPARLAVGESPASLGCSYSTVHM